MSHRRSVSEPSLSVHCSSYSRERTRRSDLAYEKGKDKLAHWIGACGQDEVSRELCFYLMRTINICPFWPMPCRCVRYFELYYQDVPSLCWNIFGQ